MPPAPTNHDQSDRPAHPWAVAEPGSWSELSESTAFVLKSGGLCCHPFSILLAGIAALTASWALPIALADLLPWQGEGGFWVTLWAWVRLTWLVGVASFVGVVLARMVSARPTRAEVWGVLPPMLMSASLCVSTYVATLFGLMLAAWLAQAVGGWFDNSFGDSLAAAIGFLAVLVGLVSTLLLFLAIPSIAANDADAPDALQRAAAHLLARPGLSLVLLAMAIVGSLAAAGLTISVLAWVTGVLTQPLPIEFEFRWWPAPDGLVWLPYTVWLVVLFGLGWTALTQVLLTLREVVDREDRASCWDPRPQAEAIRQAIEARAMIGGHGGHDLTDENHEQPDQT
ncbi:MAG: hypothetical protein KIT54_03805 [Phycisphaeraceae bacterium]|nr:hypothetical protein [Phycisphaeraceae bacterium]